jgi:hypothetical protein
VRQIAEIVVTASGLFLIGLGAVMLVKPAVTERFITSFASSRKAHFTEMFFRLLFGVSLALLSMTMWQPDLFRILAWAIIGSSVLLLLLPWQLHQRFGSRILPVLVRYMRLYAIGVLTFGVLIVYGVYHPYISSPA